ncbi:hypothetical protein LCGC14_0567810 [marine sediment metagenome]|uniref:Uncharacterized protein n=1 Tax=marine sediment metagenome TaxID=412755 RepID=A0A0F9U6F1_9ZZZZ
MSDLGETFDGLREHSQKKRAANRASSRGLLEHAGVAFTVHNDGAHLVVAGRWDFWPGTGKWIDRQGGKYRRGVFPLIKAIRSAAR